MKHNWICITMLAVATMTALHSLADDMPHDTVYFYNSWERVLEQAPSAVSVDPYFEMAPFEVYFETGDESFNERIIPQSVAATIGDSIWLVNSKYLKKNFKGDAGQLYNFVPLYFNDKVAFATYSGSFSVKDLFFGSSDEPQADYYYIDFANRKVRRVTPAVLSELLEDYHDLQMRYEGMKDYKKRYIIEDYFFKFVDRATSDVMRPFILDLVDNDN